MIKPSSSELAILKTLGRHSPLSAREIHDQVAAQLQWSFSSTRKTLERMQQKALLNLQEVHGVKVYVPAVSKVKTLALYVKELTRQILEVDSDLPVTMFANSKLLDPDELQELEQWLQQDADEDARHE